MVATLHADRRPRRSKSDQLDLGGLLNLLARYVAGDRRGWRVVRVPSVADEDARQLHRPRETLQADRTRVVNRLKAVMATLGVRVPVATDFLAAVEAARLWDATAIPPGARDRLQREWRQLQGIEAQLAEVRTARNALPVDVQTTTGRYVHGLQTLRAIGPTGAWVLATEIFGWREIRNQQQLGALVGLVPARHQSGAMQRDLGITAPATPMCGGSWCNWRGGGSAISRRARSVDGIKRGLVTAAHGYAALGWSRSRGNY